MILSIDCGIKNLALCLISNQKVIHNWEVAGVPPMHADGVFANMVKHLEERAWMLEATTIVIEKQPDKNRSIKAIENLLHTYFLVKKKNVVIWDARHKIPDCAGPGKAMYAKRKKVSIERSREFIDDTGRNSKWLGFFDKHKKKDDLADTVMQALSYIDKKPEIIEIVEPVKISPRKPTENQQRTKYSKSNLAWIIKSNGKQDARFKKDLARYYASLEDLLKDIKV